jgi:hypothetical protein
MHIIDHGLPGAPDYSSAIKLNSIGIFHPHFLYSNKWLSIEKWATGKKRKPHNQPPISQDRSY